MGISKISAIFIESSVHTLFGPLLAVVRFDMAQPEFALRHFPHLKLLDLSGDLKREDNDWLRHSKKLIKFGNRHREVADILEQNISGDFVVGNLQVQK